MPRLEYEITVRDESGKVIRKIRSAARSFVTNFMMIIYSVLTGYEIYVTNTEGSDVTIPYGFTDVDNFLDGSAATAGEGDDSYGIVVGSGTKSVTSADYNLESKISHGDGDGMLHYYETNVGGVYDTEMEVTRDFKNNGSTDVTISEVGLIVRFVYKKGGSPGEDMVMIARDLIDPPVTVPPGGVATVKYTLRTHT